MLRRLRLAMVATVLAVITLPAVAGAHRPGARWPRLRAAWDPCYVVAHTSALVSHLASLNHRSALAHPTPRISPNVIQQCRPSRFPCMFQGLENLR